MAFHKTRSAISIDEYALRRLLSKRQVLRGSVETYSGFHYRFRQPRGAKTNRARRFESRLTASLH